MDSIESYLRKLIVASVGAADLGCEKLGKLLDECVARGEVTVEKGRVLNEELKRTCKQAVTKDEAEKPAVDVDAMLDLTADGHGTKVGSSMYPAFTKYFDASLAGAYPHDVEKAKALLAEAGYPDGFSFTITVPSNYQPHVDTAEVLAAQLAEVGVTAEIDLVDWNTWLEDVYGNRNFEATVVGFDSSILNASGMLARWITGSDQNMINYSDPNYDAAYAAAQATVDDAGQTAHYKECLQILSDTAANVYLQDLADFVAIRPDLEGFQFYPLYVIDMSLLHFAD